MTTPLPPKKEVALALLERSSVYVHLDPRAAGVVVPVWFKKQPQLVLQIGLNMPVPIPDLRLDEGAMSCTLSFNRSPFYCVVPWTSVYALVGDDGRGMVWPDDVPPEVAQQARGPAVAAKKTGTKRVPTPSDAEARPGAAKPKRAKKRPRAIEEVTSDARAGLVAVPSATERRTPAPPPRPIAAIAEPAAARSAEAPRRPAQSPPRPKRELPPYLRVVK